jgi:hypothetical protein
MNTEKQLLQKILSKVDQIEAQLLDQNSQKSISDFISEEDAKKALKRSTTWFWELRKSGFPFTKLGGQVFYNKKDLINHFEENMKSGINS